MVNQKFSVSDVEFALTHAFPRGGWDQEVDTDIDNVAIPISSIAMEEFSKVVVQYCKVLLRIASGVATLKDNRSIMDMDLKIAANKIFDNSVTDCVADLWD